MLLIMSHFTLLSSAKVFLWAISTVVFFTATPQLLFFFFLMTAFYCQQVVNYACWLHLRWTKYHLCSTDEITWLHSETQWESTRTFIFPVFFVLFHRTQENTTLTTPQIGCLHQIFVIFILFFAWEEEPVWMHLMFSEL